MLLQILIPFLSQYFVLCSRLHFHTWPTCVQGAQLIFRYVWKNLTTFFSSNFIKDIGMFVFVWLAYWKYFCGLAITSISADNNFLSWNTERDNTSHEKHFFQVFYRWQLCRRAQKPQLILSSNQFMLLLSRCMCICFGQYCSTSSRYLNCRLAIFIIRAIAYTHLKNGLVLKWTV